MPLFPEKRVHVELADLHFGVLDDFMKTGLEYHDEVTELRAVQKRQREAAPPPVPATQALARAGWTAARKRKKAGDTLRDREPW